MQNDEFAKALHDFCDSCGWLLTLQSRFASNDDATPLKDDAHRAVDQYKKWGASIIETTQAVRIAYKRVKAATFIPDHPIGIMEATAWRNATDADVDLLLELIAGDGSAPAILQIPTPTTAHALWQLLKRRVYETRNARAAEPLLSQAEFSRQSGMNPGNVSRKAKNPKNPLKLTMTEAKRIYDAKTTAKRSNGGPESDETVERKWREAQQ